jgi:hypothetical protein
MSQTSNWACRLAVAAAAMSATTVSAQESSSLGEEFLPAQLRAKLLQDSGGGAGGSDLDATAMKLQNPIADILDVTLRFDVDTGLGETDATRTTLFIEPIIPFEVNPDWNLITKTTLPIIEQENLVPGAGDNHGIGDIEQSFFFTPKEMVKGWMWGAGPVISWPTASDDALGSQKYEFGPTAVAVQQRDAWTYGVLMNHLWSIPSLGDSDRRGVNATLFQPFGAYTTANHTTLAVNTETIYDWEIDRWTVPVNFVVSQLLDLQGHPVNLFAGLRTYLDSPSGGPNWGVRFGLTFVLPSKR